MLIDLPNGNWIDHAAVMGVRVINSSDGIRVLIHTSQGYLEDIPFASADSAVAWTLHFSQMCREGDSQ